MPNNFEQRQRVRGCDPHCTCPDCIFDYRLQMGEDITGDDEESEPWDRADQEDEEADRDHQDGRPREVD